MKKTSIPAEIVIIIHTIVVHSMNSLETKLIGDQPQKKVEGYDIYLCFGLSDNNENLTKIKLLYYPC